MDENIIRLREAAQSGDFETCTHSIRAVLVRLNPRDVIIFVRDQAMISLPYFNAHYPEFQAPNRLLAAMQQFNPIARGEVGLLFQSITEMYRRRENDLHYNVAILFSEAVEFLQSSFGYHVELPIDSWYREGLGLSVVAHKRIILARVWAHWIATCASEWERFQAGIREYKRLIEVYGDEHDMAISQFVTAKEIPYTSVEFNRYQTEQYVLAASELERLLTASSDASD